MIRAEKKMSFLPPELQPYSSIISLILLFADGLLFGLAAKKGLVSIILIIIGLVLAGLIGLSIPFLSAGNVWSHVVEIFSSEIGHLGPVFVGFPIVWIIGFGFGIWKG